jgi:site-specific DNA-methyltransferase (adenine-specific)
MLNGGHLKELHDYKRSADCFPGIRNGGGICYFLWDRSYNSSFIQYYEHDNTGIIREENRQINEYGDTFVRDSIACHIIRKVRAQKEKTLSTIVYTQKPFGFRTNFVDFDKDGDIKIYNKKSKCGYDYVRKSRVTVNAELIDKWKLVTSRSTSVPEEDNGQVLRLSQTFLVEPGAVVTESYVLIGAFDTKQQAENCYHYLLTKFFRFLCQQTIVSPDVSKRTFMFVPIVDFNETWTDVELYDKYGLNEDEKQYIEDTIREAGGDNNA